MCKNHYVIMYYRSDLADNVSIVTVIRYTNGEMVEENIEKQYVS